MGKRPRARPYKFSKKDGTTHETKDHCIAGGADAADAGGLRLQQRDPSGNGDAAVSGTTDSTEEATATVSGGVNRLDDYLVLLTEDETYAVFDFGEDVDPAELEEGDSVTVTYTGELGSEDPAPVAVSITKSETA